MENKDTQTNEVQTQAIELIEILHENHLFDDLGTHLIGSRDKNNDNKHKREK